MYFWGTLECWEERERSELGASPQTPGLRRFRVPQRKYDMSMEYAKNRRNRVDIGELLRAGKEL